ARGAADLGAAPVVEVGRELEQLGADELPARGLALEQLGEARGLLPLVLELLGDDEDLELGEAVEAQLEDRIDLLLAQLEAPDQLRRRVLLALRAADDADGLVERVQDLHEAFEDV